MGSSQLLSDYGPLVGALVTAVGALVTVVIVLWRQNQNLHRERIADLKAAGEEALEREEKVHRTVAKLESVLQAFGQSVFPQVPPRT